MTFAKTTVSALALLLGSAVAATAFPATSTTTLNVRSGPGTHYSVIDNLEPGETVEVTAESGGWYQIDGQGWASANYLDAGGVSTSYYVDDGYYADYGPASYYYGSYPAYYDSGYYFYVRDGHRHRVERHLLRHVKRAIRHEIRKDHREDRREVRQERRKEHRTDRREARPEYRAERRHERVERRAERPQRAQRAEHRAERPQRAERRVQRAERRQTREGRASTRERIRERRNR
jgi:uncharacterized protein YraI